MNRKALTIAVGLLLGGTVVLGGTPQSASAASFGSILNDSATSRIAGDNSLVQEVQSHRRAHRRAHRYDRHRHGPRYRHRRHGYHHYHNGYWYRTPWWAGAAAAAGALGIAGAIANSTARAANSSAHVTWCSQRYRSYNPATDTFTGYDGRQYRCNSPY